MKKGKWFNILSLLLVIVTLLGEGWPWWPW